jgi:hypothetical protein
MLSRTLAEKRKLSWSMTPTCVRTEAIVTVLRSIPSMRTLPESGL